MSGTHGSSQDLEARLHALLEPVVRDAGLFLEDVAVTGSARRQVVRVTVDLADGPGGVSSDVLADASRDVSTALDGVDNLLADAYLLEVSTPGIDRPLTQARHFRRAEGRLVTLHTADGEVTARVTGVEGEAVQLLDERAPGGPRSLTVPLGSITRGQVEVELNRVADATDER